MEVNLVHVSIMIMEFQTSHILSFNLKMNLLNSELSIKASRTLNLFWFQLSSTTKNTHTDKMHTVEQQKCTSLSQFDGLAKHNLKVIGFEALTRY